MASRGDQLQPSRRRSRRDPSRRAAMPLSDHAATEPFSALVNPPQPLRPDPQPRRQRREPSPTSPRSRSLASPAAVRPRRPRRSTPATRRSRVRQPSIRLPLPLAYALRLVVLGIGVAGIAGLILSTWNPALNPQPQADATTAVPATVRTAQAPSAPRPVPREVELSLGTELTDLKTNLESLAAQVPGLTLSAFLYDLDTRAYFNLNGGSPIPAASTIKVPILVAFLQDVDAGLIKLDEPLTMQPQQIASGSGDLQVDPPGSVYSALETASWMIINSDNTATNMLIDRLGGAAALNTRFQEWGLENTVIRNPLPDLEGTNTTSPEDLVSLLALVNQGDLMTMRSRDRLFAIMQRTYTKTLLPQGLSESDLISHKTGDIGALVGDVGLIDLENGKRYAIAVLVQRPHNDGRAQELIRRVSSTVHDRFNVPLTPATPNSP